MKKIKLIVLGIALVLISFSSSVSALSVFETTNNRLREKQREKAYARNVDRNRNNGIFASRVERDRNNGIFSKRNESWRRNDHRNTWHPRNDRRYYRHDNGKHKGWYKHKKWHKKPHHGPGRR